MDDTELAKLRRKGAFSEKDLALLSGNYNIPKGRNRLIGDFKKDRDIGSKSKVGSTFSSRKGRFTIKDVSDRQFYNIKKELQEIID